MISLNVAYLCLALNVYHEAGVDPIEGQMAVALVTMNRVYETKTDVCSVVLKPKQFSWTNNAFDVNGSIKQKYVPKGPNWERAKAVAKLVLKRRFHDFTSGATHFYADYIKPPKWSKNMTYLGKWGTHYFFKVGPRKGLKIIKNE